MNPTQSAHSSGAGAFSLQVKKVLMRLSTLAIGTLLGAEGIGEEPVV